MTYKHLLALLVIVCLLIITDACGNNKSVEQNDKAKQEENDQIEQKEEDVTKNKDKNETEEDELDAAELQLTQLLPYKAGYTWKYDGSVEYGHRMNLESIDEEDEKTIYAVEGEVEDVSGGESEKDISIDLTYTVTSDSLIQIVDSETMMDNNFSEIELIQTPLAEGTEWTQTRENIEGKEVTLESTIESIREDGEQKIYTVLYEDVDSDYYEKREIKEGVGVLSFEHLYIFENDKEESMPMGYEIYYDGTGFDKSDSR